MIKEILSSLSALALLAGATGQRPAAWQDDLADQMVGTWKLEGTVFGRAAHHSVTVQWVSGHQFLQLHEQTSRDAPASESRYDATWFLGYDDISDRYVLHLMDVYGGRFSETLGYGTRDHNDLRFVFEYPDGPFHTVWRWLPQAKQWEWHMEQKNKDGKWKPFGDFNLTRI